MITVEDHGDGLVDLVELLEELLGLLVGDGRALLVGLDRFLLVLPSAVPVVDCAVNSLFGYQSWYGMWFCMVMSWMNWLDLVFFSSSNVLL